MKQQIEVPQECEARTNSEVLRGTKKVLVFELEKMGKRRHPGPILNVCAGEFSLRGSGECSKNTGYVLI
jgi:hypothetical protein